MSAPRLWSSCVLLVGCAAPTFEAATPKAPEVVVPAAASAPTRLDAKALAHAAMLCFVGGAPRELLGGKDRCGVVTDTIGADASSRTAVRLMAPAAVDAVASALGDPRWAALVKRTADASREAIAARRKDADDVALAAHPALAALFAEKDAAATVVALTLAADRLESVHGLAPRRKIAAATPAFKLLLQLEPPSDVGPGAWLAWVSAAAKAAGRPAPATGTTHARAQAAFAGVAFGVAQRFEVAGQAAEGDLRSLAEAYARHLRAEVAQADATAKAMEDAKATADAAEKKAPAP